MTCLYKGVKKDNLSSSILIDQAKKGKLIFIIKYQELKALNEDIGQIYYSNIIASYI